jgi:hypothetical protein
VAFKTNTQPPDMVSLALHLMQSRRDRELEERKLSLQEAKLAQDARLAAIQEQRDSRLFELDLKEREATLKESGISLDNAVTEKEMGMGQSLEAVNNPALDPGSRHAAARAIDMFVQSQAGQGRNPVQVGANIGSGLGLMKQARSQEFAVKEGDALLQEQFDIRAEGRGEARDIRREKREMEARSILEKAEADAIESGIWTPKQITDLGVANEKRLSFTADLSKEWNRLSDIDVKNPTHVLEIINKWQKKVDEGAVVREGDITMLRSVGASGASNFFSSAKALVDAKKAFPPGFAENLKESYEAMLSADDQKAVDIQQEWTDYAERNRLTPAQRSRAERWQRQVRQAEERLDKRSAAPATAPRRVLSRDRARALGLE